MSNPIEYIKDLMSDNVEAVDVVIIFNNTYEKELFRIRHTMMCDKFVSVMPAMIAEITARLGGAVPRFDFASGHPSSAIYKWESHYAAYDRVATMHVTPHSPVTYGYTKFLDKLVEKRNDFEVFRDIHKNQNS